MTQELSPQAIDQSVPDKQELLDLGQQALNMAKDQGASAAAVSLGGSSGLSTQLRNGELESVEFQRDNDLAITVYFGQRRGHANTGDLKPASVKEIVAAACTIARNTQEDPAAGLPDPGLLATDLGDPQQDHPSSLSIEQSREWAAACEQAAFEFDPRIQNSEGASVHAHRSRDILMNSDGFAGDITRTDYSLSVAVIGKTESDMQRDYWYSRGLKVDDLASPAEVGKIAARRTIQRLEPRKLKTQRAAIIFPPQLARGLIGHAISAASGGALYRRASFLLDKIDEQIFSANFNLTQTPHIAGRYGCGWFDSEGVATRDHVIVENGVLKTYLLGSYSARKLGLTSTGNAGGLRASEVKPTVAGGETEFMHQAGTGLLVTELMGQGVNGSTGDYSRGAAGIWFEDGQPAYPVAGVTIAGNLLDIYRGIQAVGSDIDTAATLRCGSILFDGMTIAGE